MPLSAEQFAEKLPDLHDGGRWVELEAGEVVVLDPPDDAHGNIVLNFSKALAAYLAERRSDPPGYACFDVGLIVARGPDSVRRPAISFFTGAGMFRQTEEFATETVPSLVIEAAASPRRRRTLAERIEAYHRHGIAHVWVADPHDRLLHVCPRGGRSRRVSERAVFTGEPVLSGFEILVADVFAEPSWWRDASP
ncbi:MAG: Uma2 family endonuclease [Planctomycetaceae bacterium]